MSETILEERLHVLRVFESLFLQWLSENVGPAVEAVTEELKQCHAAIKDHENSLWHMKAAAARKLFIND